MFVLENFISGLENVLPNMCLNRDVDKIFIQKTKKINAQNLEKKEILAEISISEVELILDDLSKDTTFNDFTLYNKVDIEIPLKSHDTLGIPHFLYSNERFFLREHNYSFFISKASPKYIVALLCSIQSDIKLDLVRKQFFQRDLDDLDTFEEMCDWFRIITVKIVAPVECKISEFKKMLHSYLFNISYNSNEVYSVADLSEYKRPTIRKFKRGGQLFPYKTYNPELVKYYYQGTSTDIPFTQYLAFYHVAEFFFQSIVEEDALKEIEKFITRPSFSPYKKNDIKEFYDKIRKKIQNQKENGEWNEKIGLLLCIKKFVPDLQTLKSTMLSIDPSSSDYYLNKNNSIISNGFLINFEDESEEIYKCIRNRIYSVRNAIVHSKEGEKLRYEPFKHDKELVKEIPLIRAVAEEIIINSAKPIEIKYSE